jgi:hypothetical protein
MHQVVGYVYVTKPTVSHALRMVFEVKCSNGTIVCIELKETLNLLNFSSFRNLSIIAMKRMVVSMV